jgi:hypothetical protein
MLLFPYYITKSELATVQEIFCEISKVLCHLNLADMLIAMNPCLVATAVIEKYRQAIHEQSPPSLNF